MTRSYIEVKIDLHYSRIHPTYHRFTDRHYTTPWIPLHQISTSPHRAMLEGLESSKIGGMLNTLEKSMGKLTGINKREKEMN